MHTHDERKKHIDVDTIWNEAFDSSLEYQSEHDMHFIVNLTNQYKYNKSDGTTKIIQMLEVVQEDIDIHLGYVW